MPEPHRIVSLLPSATEIVCALGAGDRLVGVSHECDFPPAVRGLPVLTAPRVAANRPSRHIDRDVKALLRDALAVFRIDEPALAAAAPDLVLTQSQCEACAVSLDQVERAVAACLAADVRVVSLQPGTLGEVWDDIGRVAAALGRPADGAALAAALRDRVAGLARRAGGQAGRPRVACIEWLDPPMTAGNWVPELVAAAGGEPLLAVAGRQSDWLAWDELVAADPDVVVAMPCGFDIARCRGELPALTARPGWADLRAVRAGRVVLADGNGYFNRPGPRLADSAEILAEILHPSAFPPRHEGTGWQRLSPDDR
ncbi:MAG: cobalamin-binding protein [Alphaproteobacteria bacterium]